MRNYNTTQTYYEKTPINIGDGYYNNNNETMNFQGYSGLYVKAFFSTC